VWLALLLRVFFFFSSRRRHTRFSRDWSSDVCSSDLLSIPDQVGDEMILRGWETMSRKRIFSSSLPSARCPWSRPVTLPSAAQARSEERRVGKECRARGWRSHDKKEAKIKEPHTHEDE